MRKILESNEETGREFSTRGGICLIQLENHAGGEWQLESKKISGGGWVQDEMTFEDSGIKAWYSADRLTYRLTGGNVGAEANLLAAHDVGNRR